MLNLMLHQKIYIVFDVTSKNIYVMLENIYCINLQSMKNINVVSKT